LTPVWIGLELSVTYATVWLATVRAPRWHGRIAFGTFTALLFAGGVCGLISNRQAAWWADSNDAPIIPIARVINASADPIIVYSGRPYYLLGMAPILKPTTRFRLSTNVRAQVAKTDNVFAVGSASEIASGVPETDRLAPVRVPAVAAWFQHHARNEPPTSRPVRTVGDDEITLWRVAAGSSSATRLRSNGRRRRAAS
jgi:hypothetical protein